MGGTEGNPMIARLDYADAEGRPHSATLADDATWSGTDPVMVGQLNARIKLADRSAARGDWALYHARRMAELLGATIEVEPKDPAPPEALY